MESKPLKIESEKRRQQKREAVRRFCKAHPERIIANRKAQYEKIVQFLQAYRETHPCVDCGEPDAVVLVFDHRPGSIKKAAVKSLCSLKGVQAEVAKCDVRCANCHLRRHRALGGFQFGTGEAGDDSINN
jgi:hypothetical protein